MVINRFKKVDLLGIQYHNMAFAEARQTVDEVLSGQQSATMLFLNAEYLSKSLYDFDYARILNEADILFPDGIGLALVSRLLGIKMLGNCNGTDLTPEVLRIAASRGLKVFLLGGSDNVARTAKVTLGQWFPGLNIVGVHCGYLDDDEPVLKEINQSQTDILIVGMGAPLQEKWLHRYRDRLTPRIRIAVGGWLNYPGGRLKRAPLWMRRLRLEWMGRIWQDPLPMTIRYLKTFFKLLWVLFANVLVGRKFHRKVSICGVKIDNISSNESIEIIEQFIKNRKPVFVVTPNVDHIVRFVRNAFFRSLYEKASLVLADGMPLLWAAWFLGKPLKEKISGSDLFPRLCAVAARKKYKVFLLGGREGAAQQAALVLIKRFPGLQVVGTFCPPVGFERDEAVVGGIVKAVRNSSADILFVGLGSPKQEKWISDHLEEMAVPVSLGVGVSFEFVAGIVVRAPIIMQRLGLEWVWRLISEPARLWRRYLVDDMRIVYYLLKQKIGIPLF